MCSALKVKCIVAGEESSEAADKGKAKEVKETKSEPEFGFRELVEELRRLRQDLRELQMDLQSTHSIVVQITNQTVDVVDNVDDMTKHSVPYPEEEKEEGGISGNAREAEDDGEETLQ